jgi:hypothetical protein
MIKGRLAVGLGLLVLLVAPAAGSTTIDAADPWAAWLGCWQVVGEAGQPGQLVCVVPGAGPSAMRMLTVADDAVVDEATLTADGVGRRVEDGGCMGMEQARWSQDGRRVFLRTELDCDGVRRVSTGMLAFVARDEWVDVQSLRVGEQYASRVVHYRAVRAEDVPVAVAAQLPTGRALAQEAARLHAAAPLDIAAVVEASAAVDAPAVEALLAAAGDGFDIDARTLVLLEEQGVAPSTIDVMIALSYPQVFAVRAPAREEREYAAGGWAPAGMTIAQYCYDPFRSGMRYRAECSYYYGMRGYSPYGGLYWGYSPWGYDPYGWRYGRGPSVIIVRPDREERGAVVKGQGYTRGGSAGTGQARPRSSGGSGEGGARSSQPDRGSATPRAQPSPSGSSSPDRAAPSRSDDGGRTAKPRTGGGDGGQ